MFRLRSPHGRTPRWSGSLVVALLLATLTGCYCGNMASRKYVFYPDPCGPVPEPSDVGWASMPHKVYTGDIQPSFPPLPDPRCCTHRPTEPLHVALSEAVELSLFNSEVVRVLGGRAGTVAQSTVYDPAIADTQVQRNLGRFDPRLGFQMVWERDDLPPRFGQDGAFRRREQLDLADGGVSLRQSILLGGEVGVAYDPLYRFFPRGDNPQDLLNPQYYTPATFFFNQPLLQGFGRYVNRAPITIAATRANQSAWDFKESMLAMVRSVIEAYWSTHAARVELQAIDEVLPLAEELVRVNRARFRQKLDPEANVAQAESQLYEFRRLRIRAANEVQNRENLLRNVLGLPPDDCRPIHLKESPQTRYQEICWDEVITVSMEQRPDIMRRRLAVRVRELERVLAGNAYKPRLDAFGFWRVNGLGEDLGEATDLLFDNDFTDWNLGFALNVPINRRQGAAQVRAATLSLARDRALLNETAHEATHELATIVRNIHSVDEQLQVVSKVRESARRWRDGAKARYLQPAGRGTTLDALNNYLQALREYSDAARRQGFLEAQYHISWARLEEAKGTLLLVHNVVLDLDCCRAAAAQLTNLAHYDEPVPVPPPRKKVHPEKTDELPVPRSQHPAPLLRRRG